MDVLKKLIFFPEKYSDKIGLLAPNVWEMQDSGNASFFPCEKKSKLPRQRSIRLID